METTKKGSNKIVGSARKKTGTKRVVEVSGPLTVSAGKELKKRVLGNFGRGCRLELVFGDVTDVDLAFFQILAAAVKTAETGDREFTVRTPVPDKVLSVMKLTGLLNHERCTKQGCVWCAVNKQAQGV